MRWSARRPRSPPRSGRCSAASSPPTCPGASASCWRSSSSRSCCRRSGSSRTSRTRESGRSTSVGAVLSVVGMGGVVLGILVWQEGGDYVVLLIAIGALALWALARWLVRRHREGKVTLLDPDLFRAPALQGRDHRADAAEHHARRGDDRAADLPADQARIRRPADGPVARPALADHVRRRDPRRTQVRRPAPRQDHPGRVRAEHAGPGADHPDRARRGLRLVPPHPAGDRGSGARPAGVAAQQLHARPDRRRADQRGGRGELGVGVLRAVVRPGGGRRRPARDPLPGLHQHDEREPRDPLHAAAADRADAGGRRAGREQHATRRTARRRAPGRPGGDPQPSTPTRRTSPFRWRCSCRSSRASSGSSTRSA